MTLFQKTLIECLLTIVAVFVVCLIDKEHREQTAFMSARALLFGMVLFISAVLLNSMENNNWSSNYIYDFMMLEKVGDWLFSTIALGSYFLVSGGLAGVISTYIGNKLDKK